MTDHTPHARPSQLVSDADIARLNSRLPRCVRFSLSLSGGRAQTVVATLAMARPGGRVSEVSHRLASTSTRRDALRSIAESFAECAMALGLGSGVYGSGVPVLGPRLSGESP